MAKKSLDEKKYREILAEEELEEQQFKKSHSFNDTDKKVEKTVEKKEVVVKEEYVDDTDYDEYANDYSSFNSIKEDYDKEEDIYIDTTEEVEDNSYSFDNSLIVSIISSLYKWIAIVAMFLAGLLVVYLLVKAKFVAVFLYIISLVCAFLFGYILMFVVNMFFFKE